MKYIITLWSCLSYH